MTFVLILFTVLPTWFVGPLPMLDLPPGTPPVYYDGPSLIFPVQPTANGVDRMIVIVDPSPSDRGARFHPFRRP